MDDQTRARKPRLLLLPDAAGALCRRWGLPCAPAFRSLLCQRLSDLGAGSVEFAPSPTEWEARALMGMPGQNRLPPLLLYGCPCWERLTRQESGLFRRAAFPAPPQAAPGQMLVTGCPAQKQRYAALCPDAKVITCRELLLTLPPLPPSSSLALPSHEDCGRLESVLRCAAEMQKAAPLPSFPLRPLPGRCAVWQGQALIGGQEVSYVRLHGRENMKWLVEGIKSQRLRYTVAEVFTCWGCSQA